MNSPNAALLVENLHKSFGSEKVLNTKRINFWLSIFKENYLFINNYEEKYPLQKIDIFTFSPYRVSFTLKFIFFNSKLNYSIEIVLFFNKL